MPDQPTSFDIFQYRLAVRDSELRTSDKAILLILSLYPSARSEGTAYPSVATLAKQCSLTPRSITSAFRRLCTPAASNEGWLHKEKRNRKGLKTTSLLTFVAKKTQQIPIGNGFQNKESPMILDRKPFPPQWETISYKKETVRKRFISEDAPPSQSPPPVNTTTENARSSTTGDSTSADVAAAEASDFPGGLKPPQVLAVQPPSSSTPSLVDTSSASSDLKIVSHETIQVEDPDHDQRGKEGGGESKSVPVGVVRMTSKGTFCISLPPTPSKKEDREVALVPAESSKAKRVARPIFLAGASKVGIGSRSTEVRIKGQLAQLGYQDRGEIHRIGLALWAYMPQRALDRAVEYVLAETASIPSKGPSKFAFVVSDWVKGIRLDDMTRNTFHEENKAFRLKPKKVKQAPVLHRLLGLA